MITSVWERSDREFLEEAVPFYLRGAGPGWILDANWGKGTFWRGSSLAHLVTGIDCDPTKSPEVVADNRRLPFQDAVFGCVTYDPPHVTHGWSAWDSSDRYSVAQGRGSINYLFPDFLAEAHSVLLPHGILIAKLADQIHTARYWWQTVDFVLELRRAGFIPCDRVVKIRVAARPQPGGRRVLHAARRHSDYIIARKGGC